MSTRFADHILGPDTHTNRPTATAVPAGAVYACTTDSKLEQSNGSAWSDYFSGGVGGSSLTVDDEGTPLATAATTLDFVGAGVTASGTGATKTITIPGGGGAAISRLGKTTVGASTLAAANVGIAKKVTLSATGVLLSINTYLDMNSDASVNPWAAVYDDVSGTPTHVLAVTHGADNANTGGPNMYLETAGGSGFAARWMAFPIGLYLAAGDYWIVTQFNGSGSPRFYYDTGGSDKTISYSGFGWGDASRINTQGTSTRDHSTYAVILS